MDKFVGQIGKVRRIDELQKKLSVDFTEPYSDFWTYPLNYPLAKKINVIQNKLK